MKSSNLKLMGGLALGAAAGIITGILIAPRSGKSTRRKIGLELLKYKNELQDKAVESVEEIKDATDYATNNLKRSARKQWHELKRNSNPLASLMHH